MESVTVSRLESFLRRLGERYPGAGAFNLLGGSALCWLGNRRTTVDVDYTFELDAGSPEPFQVEVAELAAEMHLDVEWVPLEEFVPCRRTPTNDGVGLGASVNWMVYL
jgi:hypothetical protein